MLTLDHSMINWKRSRVSQVHPWPPWDTNRSRPLDLGRFGDQPRIGTAHIFEVDPGLWPYLKKKQWWAHLSLVQKPVFDKKYHHFMDQRSSFQQSFRQTPKLRKLYTEKSPTSDPSNHYPSFSITFPSLFHHISITFPGYFMEILLICSWHLASPTPASRQVEVSQVSGHKTWPEKKRAIPQPVPVMSKRWRVVPLSSLSWSLGSLGSLDISQGWGTRL